MLALRTTRRLATQLQPRPRYVAGIATDANPPVMFDLLNTLGAPPTAAGTTPPHILGSQNPARSTNPLDAISQTLENNPVYRLHVMSGRNNTINNFTKPNGNSIARASGGSCGFKGKNEAGYEAGYQAAVKIFKCVEAEYEKVPNMKLEVFFKGFGQGREALRGALLTSEGEILRPLITRITDTTPIKIGGTRPKKRRRL